MKEGTSPEGPKARESRGEPRVERVRGSGPCRGVIERPGGSRHDSCLPLRAEPRRGKAPVWRNGSEVGAMKNGNRKALLAKVQDPHKKKNLTPKLRGNYFVVCPDCEVSWSGHGRAESNTKIRLLLRC